MEILTETPVIITDSARIQLEKIKDFNHKITEQFGVKGGGCSGFSYVLGFDTQKANDQEYIINGIKVFMDPAHALYLVGMQIEWVEGLNNRGFSFVNPNAKDTCGCGQSFSA